MAASRSTLDGIAYRESGSGDRVALLLHGYPQSSLMWEPAMAALAESGWRGVAPDLPGFGDSPPDRPGTWERQIEAVMRLHAGLALGPVALVMHDWGALIGLRWACENPGAVRALVISSSGFFPDGKWHGMARGMRTEGTGEQLLDGMTRESFGELMRWASRAFDDTAIDEYWRCFADAERRAAQLDLYRSGDFEKLARYEGQLAALGVPTLLLWGSDDQFAPLAGGHRLDREIPHAELQVLDGVGHFVWDDEPERSAAALSAFVRALH